MTRTVRPLAQPNGPPAADPAMPRLMPPHVEKAIAERLGFRNRPNPIEIYDAIREALERGPR